MLNILFYLRSSIETDKNLYNGQQYVQKRGCIQEKPPNLDYLKYMGLSSIVGYYLVNILVRMRPNDYLMM